MAYARYTERLTEYQGESFSKTLYKTSGDAWSETEGGIYQFIDDEGTILANGDLTKSDGDLGLSFHVPDTTTADILGNHILLVSLEDTGDTTFNDVIAEYKIKYVERKA